MLNDTVYMVNGSNGNDRHGTRGVGQGVGRRRFLGVAGTTALGLAAGCLGDEEADTDVVRIGHLAPTAADVGVGSERAAELAVEEINDDGGIMDTEVELLSVDTHGTPSEGVREAEDLVGQEDVDLLIGTQTSEVTLAILDFVANERIPFLVTGSAAPEVTADYLAEDYEQYKTVFRPGPLNSVYQAEELANYAELLNDEHGWTTFGQLAESAAWTEFFSERLPGELEDRGFDVPYEDRISTETDDFGPILGSLESAGVDAVFKQFAHLPGTGMLSAWRANEYPFGQEGVSVPSMSPEYWDDTNGGCEFETTGESGAGGVAPLTENTQALAEAYAERYGDDRPSAPMYMGFGTYDAIHIYREAVERAGTFDYHDDVDTIVDELLETEYVGTTGTIVFGEPDSEYPHDAELGPTRYPITQWVDGSKECVYPADDATADHRLADWL